MKYSKVGPELSSAAQAERNAVVKWLRATFGNASLPIRKLMEHEADAIEAGLHRVETESD